jgi:hypothetical protein
VAADPSVQGNELREFRSEKCIKLSKSRSPNSRSNRGPLIQNQQGVIDLSGSASQSLEGPKHRSPEVVEVPKCRSTWQQILHFRGFSSTRFFMFHFQNTRSPKARSKSQSSDSNGHATPDLELQRKEKGGKS